VAQKLIIDADPGIGDALAILVAMADPSVEVIGLTAVAGTVSGVQATRNLHYLVGLADPLRHPRVGQSDAASSPAEEMSAGVPHPQALNGRFGLGDVDPLVPDLHNRRESAKLIVDLVREHPQEVRLIEPISNSDCVTLLARERNSNPILRSMTKSWSKNGISATAVSAPTHGHPISAALTATNSTLLFVAERSISLDNFAESCH